MVRGRWSPSPLPKHQRRRLRFVGKGTQSKRNSESGDAASDVTLKFRVCPDGTFFSPGSPNQVRIEQSKALLREHSDPDTLLALVYSPAKREEEIHPEELSRIGLTARIIRILNMPGGNVQVTLEGLRRIRIEDILRTEPYLIARVTCPEETVRDAEKVHTLISRILKSLRTLTQLDKAYPPELDNIFGMNLGDPGLFADTVTSIVRLPVETKKRVIEALDVEERLGIVAVGIDSEIARLSVAEDVVRRTSAQLEKNQREFFLAAAVMEIRRLLGERTTAGDAVAPDARARGKPALPSHVRAVMQEEANRLRFLLRRRRSRGSSGTTSSGSSRSPGRGRSRATSGWKSAAPAERGALRLEK